MTSDTRLAPATCSDAPLWSAWMAAFHAPAIAIADDLGVFTALAERPASAAELAARLGVEARATEALGGLLVALELLVQLDGRLHLTEVARSYLLPASPYYWGGLLRRIREAPLDCRRLIAGLRRGTAADEARISSQWRPTAPPEVLAGITHAMHAHSFSLAMRTVAGYGLAGARRLLDVGGGSGSYSIAAALLEPELRCLLLDLPPVCDVAAGYLARFEVAGRVELVARDMFVDPWPEGCDRVLFSDIFHDWDDAQCLELARRARAALAPGGRVLVHELVLADAKDGSAIAAAYSVVMLFATRGRQRTARELAALLEAAGLADVEMAPTAGGYALISATRR